MDWQELSCSTTVEGLRDSEGKYMGLRRLSVGEEDLLDVDWTESVEPVKEDYHGNERVTIYRPSVLVFWPTKMHAANMLSLECEEYSLKSLVGMLGEEGDISPFALPPGITSPRDWLDSAIKHECSGSKDSFYYCSHNYSRMSKRVLAMQGMARLGNSNEDVFNLLKTFRPLLDASPSEIIEVG